MHRERPDRDIAFLLSLAALPIAGCPRDPTPIDDTATGSSTSETDPTVSTTQTSSTDSTTASTTVSTTQADSSSSSDPSATVSTTLATESGSSDAESSTSITEGTESDGSGSSSESTGAVADLCEQWGLHYAECLPDYAGYAMEQVTVCQMYLDYASMIGGPCVDATDDFFACIGAVDCDLLGGEAFGCPDQFNAMSLLCFGGPDCGDGIVDPGEQCDGDDLQGFDCESLGLGGGVLTCDPEQCTLDTSMCDA
jgi:hypothetical protein